MKPTLRILDCRGGQNAYGIIRNPGSVLNAENIKADSHKILRPTHFSCTKNIKADSFLALINIKADMKNVNNKAKNWQKPDKY